jgi:hypothetical protein
MITKIKSRYRSRLKPFLGPLAQLAFVAAIVMDRLGDPSLSFVTGILMGFSVVGNIMFLYTSARSLRGSTGK